MPGQKLDTEERANRSQINKGNHFRKDQCNGLKSLKVTSTKNNLKLAVTVISKFIRFLYEFCFNQKSLEKL